MRACQDLLPQLVQDHQIDLVIVNGENATGGLGLSAKDAQALFRYGAHAITSGNHIWRKRDLIALMEREPRLLRPANYPSSNPGQGSGLFEALNGCLVGVINLQGRVFMDPIDCPFQTADQLIEPLQNKTPIILVDFHAEATSEKRAMGWYLDGKVSVVVGTHTHVQTADEEILPYGTGYLTDVGMTGPFDSIIGMNREIVLRKFRFARPQPFETASRDPRLCAAVFEIDEKTGRCLSIQRICQPFQREKKW